MQPEMRAHRQIQLTFAAVAFLSLPAFAVNATLSLPPLDHGFQLLYSLDFDGAQVIFAGWEQSHPDDPMGPTCDAAGLLFSEFHRLGVLEGQFYVNDQAFAARKKLDPDPALRDRFNAALEQAETKAKTRLATDPKDRDALFAMT